MGTRDTSDSLELRRQGWWDRLIEQAHDAPPTRMSVIADSACLMSTMRQNNSVNPCQSRIQFDAVQCSPDCSEPTITVDLITTRALGFATGHQSPTCYPIVWRRARPASYYVSISPESTMSSVRVDHSSWLHI